MKSFLTIMFLFLMGPGAIDTSTVASDSILVLPTLEHKNNISMYKEEVNLTYPLTYEKNKIERLNDKAAILQKESEYLSLVLQDPKTIKRLRKEIKRADKISTRDSIKIARLKLFMEP